MAHPVGLPPGRAGASWRYPPASICCLRPGIKGVSENIEVHSIVGRFLEHSRVYRFHNGGQPELYLSSADMMPRNMDRRVELLFPVETEGLSQRIMQDMELYWEDTAQTSLLNSDGTYQKLIPDKQHYFNAQENMILDWEPVHSAVLPSEMENESDEETDPAK